MCGTFTNTAAPDELTRQIGGHVGVRIAETTSADRWDIRPTDPVVAIVAPFGTPEARLLRWSLLPPWATDEKMRRPLFNARLEGLLKRGDYAGVPAGSDHRALVLADGFYEWDHPEDRKQKGQPYRFTLSSGNIFAFAAVWATNTRIAATPVESCSILTCDSTPNMLLRKVHDRMPVMLTEPEQLRALSMCGPLPAELMSAEPRQPGTPAAHQQLGPTHLARRCS